MGQESGLSIGRCLWVKISHEVVIKLSARAVVSSELSTEEEEMCHVGVFTCEGLHTGLLHDLTFAFSRGEQSRRE